MGVTDFTSIFHESGFTFAVNEEKLEKAKENMKEQKPAPDPKKNEPDSNKKPKNESALGFDFI